MTFSGAFAKPFRPPFDAGLAAASNGLLNSLVAYWKLDEASGNALDAHTNGLTLTQSGSPGSAAGKVYASARVYGQNVHHRRASETLLQIADNDWTMAAWFNTKTLTNNTGPWGKYGSTSANGCYYCVWYALNLGIGFNKADNSAIVQIDLGNVLAAVDTWHFLVAWHDSVNDIVGASLDGAVPVTKAIVGGVRSNADVFSVGSYYGGTGIEDWRDRVGPVAMWKSAAGGGGCLSAAQRLALWNGGAGLAYAAFTT
jgi:hypothetical protein